MQMVNGYPIKQYVTGTRSWPERQTSNKNAVLTRQHCARRCLHKNIRTGAHFCTRLNDMRTATLWKQTDMEGVSDGMGWNFLEIRSDLQVIKRSTLTALRYRNEVLDPIVRFFAGAIGDNFILMQDNVHPHTARVCMDYLNRETIEVMDWSAHSPDLNTIEQAWESFTDVSH